MPRFKLFWKDGRDPEIKEGNDIEDAFQRAGYSYGRMASLDHYEELPSEDKDLPEDEKK